MHISSQAMHIRSAIDQQWGFRSHVPAVLLGLLRRACPCADISNMYGAQNSRRTRRRLLATFSAFTILATGCGAEAAPEATPLRGFDGEVVNLGDPLTTSPVDDAVPEEAIAFSDDAARTEESTVTTAPADLTADVLPVSTDEGRTTADGVVVRAYLDEVDFGDGPESTWWIEADHPIGGFAGVTFTPAPAETSSMDDLGWAASGGVFVIRVETGPQVVEVRLTSVEGSVDRVAPDDGRFAVLAVRTNDHEKMQLDAFDASGSIVANCIFEPVDGFAFTSCNPV